MKKENILHDLKTAGIVTTMAVTLNACGPKPLNEQELQTIEHKVDSAVNVHHEYIMASGLSDLCQAKIQEFRIANRDMVKTYAKAYIKRNIKDVKLNQYMLNAVQYENMNQMLAFCDSCEVSENVETILTDTVSYIRNNQRWFNDLMLYLAFKYNDRQLLNSDFFKVINNPSMKKKFEYNTKDIERIKPSLDFALERKKAIHDGLYRKYEQEVKRSR